MKRTVRKIKRIVCCLLVGLLLSEQIAAVRAEENGQQYAEEDAENGTVSGNDAVPDSVSDAENTANEESVTVPYAEESRAGAVGDVFTENNLQYRISDSEVNPPEVVCIGIESGSPGLELTIPSTVKHDEVWYSVWRIEDGAFAEQAGTLTNILRSVTIEQGIREIGNRAFYNCQELTKVILPKDDLEKIGEKAFCLCAKVESIDIPSSVQEIGEGAFSSCTGMSGSMRVPDGIEILKDNIFSGCFSSEILLPDSLKQIKDDVFRTNRLLHINIPKDVTWIGSCAFLSSPYLEEIKIPDGVTYIGGSAFENCAKLKSIVIPDKVTGLNSGTLADCIALESVTLPEGLTYIDYEAFRNCRSLKEVDIPGAVQYIAYRAFEGCISLTDLTVRDTVYFKGEAYPYYKDIFQQCGSFATLKIIVTGDVPLAIDPRLSNIFQDCPAERSIVFLNEDGMELTGEALKAAQAAYRAVSDGNTEDNLWYGWKIGDTPEVTYAVEIKVNLDDKPWLDSGKTFCLSKDGGNSYITDLTAVGNGTYDIYEMTGTADGRRAAGYLDTGVDVVVDGGDAEATVDYYTVTFYDGDDPYGEETQQHPQIVLKGGKAARPAADPDKEGFIFKGWMTAKDGNTLFDFDNTAIATTAGIYASWADNSVTLYQITVTANGGGIISPDGTVKVSEGADQRFTITPQEGYEIQEVLVDGKSQGVIDNYTFTNVKENHTISASFLKKEETGETEKPGEGEGGTDKPGENEGETGGTEKPGENAGGTGETEKPGENAGESGGTDRPGESESNNGGSGNSGNVGSEPKTGDFSGVEIYATAAMIAGLLYLLLSFAEMKGLTETKKKEIISSIIDWANEGRKYRRYVAFAAIFFVLVYYHSIGKSTMAEAKFC